MNVTNAQKDKFLPASLQKVMNHHSPTDQRNMMLELILLRNNF